MARSPYIGLRPFQRDEADLFFGRETHIDAMINRLGRHRLLTVTGSSGSGKSSLVRAGLLEALETGLLAPAGPQWRFAVMRPQEHPMRELAAALLGAEGRVPEPETIALRRAALERGPLSLVEALLERPLPAGTNLLIVADQFEELFRYQGLAAREEAEAFVALLLASAAQRAVPIYVVLTMRSEYLGRCAEFAGLAETVSDAQYLCPRLSREQIAAAIGGPATVCGGSVEPALVARLVNDMDIDPDQLPLMQHALMRLWDGAVATGAAQPVLRLADYLAADGFKGSLSRHADEVLAEATAGNPARTEAARRMFCLLVDGEGESAVRRPTPVAEVVAIAERPAAEIAALADAFRAAGCNFLYPGPERPLEPETLLDITHESLIRQWQVLRGWTHDEAASAERYREIERRAERWDAGEAPLWDAADLEIALAWRTRAKPSEAWAKRYGGDFDLAVRFLDESAARRDRIVASRIRRRRTVMAVLAVLVLVFAGLAGYAYQQKLAAQRSLDLATGTANGLLVNVVEKYRNAGMPTDVVGAVLDQVLTLQRQLAQGGAQWAPPPELQRSQANALIEAADTLLSLGNAQGALAAAREAHGIYQALAAGQSATAGDQRGLAVSDEKIGTVLMAQGDFPGGQADLLGAIAAYRDGLAVFRSLADRDKSGTQWRSDLVDALGNLALALLPDNQPQQTLDLADEALKLDPSAVRVELTRAHALLFLGRVDEAKAIYLADKYKTIGGRSFAAVVADDFARFRRFGINTLAMQQIEQLLAS